jgi:hypothetical protein
MLVGPSARSSDRFAALIAPNLGQITEPMLHDHDVPKLIQPKMSAAEVNIGEARLLKSGKRLTVGEIPFPARLLRYYDTKLAVL